MAWEKLERAETQTTLPALILITDELAEFLTNLPRNKMRLGDELQGNFASIAQLGRAAHIHLLLATQSSSGNMFPPTLKNNIQFRNICGRVDATVSRMAIDTDEGESIPAGAPGAYLSWFKGDSLSYQGYWPGDTKEVLKLGTMKPGYDPNTGLELSDDEDFDFSKPPEMPGDESVDDKVVADGEVSPAEVAGAEEFLSDSAGVVPAVGAPNAGVASVDPVVNSAPVGSTASAPTDSGISEVVVDFDGGVAGDVNNVGDDAGAADNIGGDGGGAPAFNFNFGGGKKSGGGESGDVSVDGNDASGDSGGLISIIE